MSSGGKIHTTQTFIVSGSCSVSDTHTNAGTCTRACARAHTHTHTHRNLSPLCTIIVYLMTLTASLMSLQKPISLIRWHPAGAFVCVLSSRGELQAYDLGLNPLLFLVNAEEPLPTPILRLDSHML